MQLHKPNIIAITETNPKNSRFNVQKQELKINRYEEIFTNADEEGVRGVAILVDHSLKVNEETPFCDGNLQEFISVKIGSEGTEQLFFTLVYRSPNSSKENSKNLNNMLRTITQNKSRRNVVVGDFNFPGINWIEGDGLGTRSQVETEFLEALNDSFLEQCVNFPTRNRQGHKPHILDLILTNDPQRIHNLYSLPGLGRSDHVCMIFDYYLATNKSPNSRKHYLYHRGNYDNLRAGLDINWKEELMGKSVSECWNNIKTKIHCAENVHIPTAKKKGGRHKPAWLTGNVLRRIRKKESLWNTFCLSGEDEDYTNYCRIRNQVKRESKKAKKAMERKIAKEAKANPKGFWKYVKNKLGRSQGMGDLKDENGRQISDDIGKADLLNNFFSSTFTTEDLNSIPPGEQDSLSSFLNDIEISESEVKKLLQNLDPSKSPGVDNIHPRILKEAAENLASPLTHLFNLSMRTGEIPEDWKSANITPLHKKGKKDDRKNYRPVSLTSICCKLIEKIIRREINSHMNNNNLYSEHQHGFLEGRSTTSQLLEYLEYAVECIEHDYPLDVIMLDFMKAFDSVPHQRLLIKLTNYGINGKIHNWIENFLTNRRQRVVINGFSSQWKDMISGVPQGSVLGPVLFAIFINDMPQAVTNRIKLYADDAKLYSAVRSTEDCLKLQEDLIRLEEWESKWQLRFHPNKCTLMRISKGHPEFAYYMRSSGPEPIKLNEVACEKDLGVYIDNQLSYEYHVNDICKRANKIVGLIWRTFEYIDGQNFSLLFKALVRPILEYATQIWAPNLWKLSDLLEEVQRRATRMVIGLKGMSYEERLKSLNLPTLQYRRIRGDLIFMYKIATHRVNTALLGENQIRNERTRGHQYKLDKRRTATNKAQSFFTNRIINIWNELPQDVVSAESVNSFKNALDIHHKTHPGKTNYKWTLKPYPLSMHTKVETEIQDRHPMSSCVV